MDPGVVKWYDVLRQSFVGKVVHLFGARVLRERLRQTPSLQRRFAIIMQDRVVWSSRRRRRRRPGGDNLIIFVWVVNCTLYRLGWGNTNFSGQRNQMPVGELNKWVQRETVFFIPRVVGGFAVVMCAGVLVCFEAVLKLCQFSPLFLGRGRPFFPFQGV